MCSLNCHLCYMRLYRFPFIVGIYIRKKGSLGVPAQTVVSTVDKSRNSRQMWVLGVGLTTRAFDRWQIRRYRFRRVLFGLLDELLTRILISRSRWFVRALNNLRRHNWIMMKWFRILNNFVKFAFFYLFG